MKTVGIIGGIGPESTIEYYRLIVARYRELKSGTGVALVSADPDTRGVGYPAIIINSIDLDQYIEWINHGEMDKFADGLIAEIQRLAKAGVDFAVLASNTPHIVFDQLRETSPVPLISIVESARDAVQTAGMKRVGLFGTRFTMRGGFYSEVFSRAGLTLIVPQPDEQDLIHQIYLGELLNNIFLPESRARLLEIADRMKERDGIEALVLGGTELPLLLRDSEHNGLALLDTTKIHVEQIVQKLL
jgi:aspartate racemase